ncbi:MAG: Tex family protein, partial [Anaerovoracaceae bacterium]
ELTGGLSDVVLRELDERLEYLKNLEARKEEVLRLIEEQGKLTEELQRDIENAEILQRVEDLYKPFKKKKSTRASKARDLGLEPLADIIRAQEMTEGNPEDVAMAHLEQHKEYLDFQESMTAQEALEGAMDILAERISDDADFMTQVRGRTLSAGMMASEGVDMEEKTPYEGYYQYQEGVSKIPNHRVLAINRGEKEKKLKVKIVAPVDEIIHDLEQQVIRSESSIFHPLLIDCIKDGYKRLMAPSIEREIRTSLTERAEKEAVKIFAKNTEKLLMVPPVKGARIISLDPGFRTGCKVAVLDETGSLLAHTTVYPTEPRNDIQGTEKIFQGLVEKYKINVMVIGNGTASRETEEVVANFIHKNNLDISYTIVNEAGASVYSASQVASDEYPDLDVTTRGAMSLGRRLQDPLAELVKIPPKSIGVGQYQHDVNQGLLDKALTGVIEDCVNRVGVDLNTASPSLLSYVAGINMGIAKNIVAYREEKGGFKERKELKKVGKLGEKTYHQCAGFLRIQGGKNPLDSTSVHPESYEATEKFLKELGIDKKEILAGGVVDIEERLKDKWPDSLEALGKAIEVGLPTLRDIMAEIKKPGRDPREEAPSVVFRNDVRKIEDLQIGMELTGTVRNVVDFGAFVDIGLKNDGLVHISELADRFVKHPMDVVSVGDNVQVRILAIDLERNKIGLTMKKK